MHLCLMLKILPFLFLLFLFSCQQEKDVNCCEIVSLPTFEIKVNYASNFDLVRTNNGYRLLIISPENGEIEKTINITPKKDHKIISLTSTLNGMISILHEQKQLVGISSINYVYDKIISDSYSKGLITSFGDETSLSLEKIINTKADIIFYSGFGEHFPHQEKLEKLGVTIIPIYDWRENHPLGKAEWIKLVGVITNTEENANAYFEEITQEYEALIEKAKSTTTSPSVLAGSIIGDVWYAPGGESYLAQMLNDANVNYRYKESKGTASLQLSIEKILKDNEKTDFWINPGQSTKSKVISSHPKVKFLSALKNNTYCYSSQQSKFWEQSAAMPHLLLKDFISIFHPEIHLEDELYFYNKIN